MNKQFYYFTFVCAIPVLSVLWWWGLFSSATVAESVRGDYYFAYLDAEDVYSKLDKKRDEVRFYLKKQQVPAETQVTLILTDPRTTPHAQLRAKTGYMVNKQYKPIPPLKLGYIPVRKVVHASIKGHPIFAYGKAYKALIAYTQAHQTALNLPTVEIVHRSVLNVEMPLQTQPDSAGVQ